MKSKRHGRLCFHVPQNRQHTRRFAGFDLGHDHHFIRQDRTRASGQVRSFDVLVEQPEKNPAGHSASRRERS
jgi:hypothetical protein